MSNLPALLEHYPTARFEESRHYPISSRALAQICQTALEECNFRVRYENPEIGFWRASAPANFWSWGEDIQIRVSEEGQVRISSVCTLFLQIFSWGKNKRNVRRLFEVIHQEAELVRLSGK